MRERIDITGLILPAIIAWHYRHEIMERIVDFLIEKTTPVFEDDDTPA